MSNRKTNTIMKKFFYSVLAVAALIGCAKEKEAPVSVQKEAVPTHIETIVASFSPETKTSYDGQGKFSWVAGDQIWVGLVKEGATDPLNSSSYDYALFTAKSSGATVEFEGEVPDYYRPNSAQIAFYPGTAQDPWYETDQSGFACRLPSSVYVGVSAPSDLKIYYEEVPADNPLKHLPLIGSKNEDGSFSFKSAVGVLKINLTDLADEAAGIVITSAEGYLSNYFIVDSDRYIKTDQVLTRETSKFGSPLVRYYFEPQNGAATVYAPIPVGTLKAGSSIQVIDASQNVLFTKDFAKDVEIARNKIVELASFKAKYEWTSVGAGKYFDKKYLAAVGAAADQSVDVQIEVDASTPGKYRIQAPYAAYNTATNYSTTESVTAPNDLVFNVYKAGDKFGGATLVNDGIVYFDPTYMGIIEPGQKKEWFLAHRTYFSSASTEADWIHSYVLKWKSDGTPAAIQLAPCYYWVGLGAYLTDCKEDGNVQILFPGETEFVDITASVAYADIADDDPDQPVANVNVVLGKDIKSASLVIAADAAGAEAAFNDASKVATVTASGSVEVKLPANAESGKYIIFASLTAADGISPLASRVISSEAFNYQASADWISLGTGKYIDNYYLYEGDFTDGTDVDVEILQSKSDPSTFRVVTPYAAYISALGYSTTQSVSAPTDLIFTIKKKGDVFVSGSYNVSITDDDEVVYEPVYMGFYDTYEEKEMFIAHPNYLTRFASDDSGWKYNYVMSYQSSGLPAVVQLAPLYYWVGLGCYTSDAYEDNKIQILFPGVSDYLDASASVSYVSEGSDDPAQPSAIVFADYGTAVGSLDIVIAQDEAAAAAAFAAGTNVTTSTTPGVEVEVNLPADAPSGEYYIYAKINAASGTTSLVNKTISSSKSFKYFRSDESLGIDLQDILGDYSGTGYVYYQGWQSGATIQMTLSESTDPALGDFVVSYFANTVATISIAAEVYGWLDSNTGAISIDPLQPINSNGAILGAYSDPTNSPVVFYYSPDNKTLTSAGMFGYFRYVSGTLSYYNVYFSPSDVPLVLTKVEQSAGAPAKVARKDSSVKSLKASKRIGRTSERIK